MNSKRAVRTEEGAILAQQLGIQFFEVSAKDNCNLKEAIFTLSRKMLDISYENQDFVFVNHDEQVAEHVGQLSHGAQISKHKLKFCCW